MNYQTRISLLQKKVPPKTALLISDSAHLFYLTGIQQLTPEEREGFLLVSDSAIVCFLTPFSPLPTNINIPVHHMSSQAPFTELIGEWSKKNQINSIQFDGNTLFVQEFETIKTKLSQLSFEMIKVDPLDELRMIKDESEILLIRKANSLTHEAILEMKKKIKVGMSEKAVKKLLEVYLSDQGVETMAFPTIVAFSDNSALPHHQPTDRKLKENEVILIDIGAKWQGYCADVTRTFWFGDTPSQQFTKVERIVKHAYSTALKTCNSDKQLQAKDIDQVARSVITKAGYGLQFIHTTGHGVGIVVHEPPSLNWKNDQLLPDHCVITIEPGIYLPGQFGYRFENSVLFSSKGCEELI